jgi:hypothetical protein
VNELLSWIHRAVVYAGLGALAGSPERPPEQPFQAVHMLILHQSSDEKKLLAAMADLNGAIAKGGCPPCAYHLWKAYGQVSGTFNYTWVSNWPGRVIYEKVHATPEYEAATKRHPDLDGLLNGQVYNRYVEVK